MGNIINMYVRTLIFIRYKTISLNLRLNLAFFSSSEGRLYEEAAGLSIIGYRIDKKADKEIKK